MKTCIYLRKSRADLESERQGEFETLTKHRTILLKTAKELKLNIVDIKEELVSGESIEHRPKMLELLDEVEQFKFDAVLVMDIDRLGRGDMRDQGTILETFKNSKTKIITPRKTYDLQDEFDEEYSEFEAFMARKELKLINRRLQRGRVRSVEDGNYLGTAAPYGYDIHFIGSKTRTLKPNKDADAVKLIFDLYVHEAMGAKKIANRLNYLGYRTSTGKEFYGSAVLNIIKNKVYCGYVQWRKKEEKKSKDPNKKTDVRTRPVEEWIEAVGKHEPLVSEELYGQAQLILKEKYHVPYHLNGPTNPLAGLIRCGCCGASMVYRPYVKQPAHITCYNACGNKSAKYEYVEGALLKSLTSWLEQYKLQYEDSDFEDKKRNNNKDLYEKTIVNFRNELTNLDKQKNNLHDLLERGIYDIDTYLERSNSLVARIEETNVLLNKAYEDLLKEQQKEEAKHDIIPTVEEVLELYIKTEDVKLKNQLLKSVLNFAIYKKEKDQTLDDFTLIIYPKLNN